MRRLASLEEMLNQWEENADFDKPRGIEDIHFRDEAACLHMTTFKTGNDLIYSSFKGEFHDDLTVQMQGRGYAFLFFIFGEEAIMQEGHTREQKHFERGRFFIGRVSEGLQAQGIYGKGKGYLNRSIVFRPELLEEVWGEEKMNLVGDSFFVSDPKPITPLQAMIFRELDSAMALEGRMQEIYAESKVLELFCKSHQCPPATLPDSLSPQDISSIHRAREILLSDIVNPPSLKELAHAAATNEFKLKKGFKSLFGTTVYGLLHEERLESAKRLLERDDVSVQEASRLVGYKSVGHFSKIFKERFSILPVELTKNRKRFLIDVALGKGRG